MRASPQKLKEARNAAGLSQVLVSERSGIHFTTYNRYEKGRLPLRDIGTIIRIAGVVGVGDFRSLLQEDEQANGEDDEDEAALRRLDFLIGDLSLARTLLQQAISVRDAAKEPA